MALESINGRNNFSVSQVSQTTPIPDTAAAKEETADATIKAPVIKTENSSSQEQQNGSEDTETTQPSLDQVKKAIDTINKKANNSTIQFGVHEATNRITIKIIDKDTKKVIREVPAEKTLDMIAKAWEMAGILVDEKR